MSDNERRGDKRGSASSSLAVRSFDAADSDATAPGTSKLCGYLNKLTGKGPLRGFRTRWFIYDPRKCYLYYFKSPQESLPLGHIEIADACFSYDIEAEEGLFEINTEGKQFLLKAPNRQLKHFWLQELQQKRWEYGIVTGRRDSWCSPTQLYPRAGLVAKDAVETEADERPIESMESVRSDFAVEIPNEELPGFQLRRGPPAQPNATINSLRNWGSELRYSMSNLRSGRGGESRRSVFYTTSNEDWEMVEPPNKTMSEHKPPADTQHQEKPSHFHRYSLGSAFTFDFRNPPRMKLPFHFGSGKSSCSAESSPLECNGSPSSELQLCLQMQQEEMNRLQQQATNLTEELSSQKQLVCVLQQTLRNSQCNWGSTAKPENPQDETAFGKIIGERDAHIKTLCGQMERLTVEKESLQQELKVLKIKVGEMTEQLAMLIETIQAKDEVIIKMTQQSGDGDNQAELATPSVTSEQQELDTLKDSLQGYKSQNNFLNKEILELTVLRRNAESREKALVEKCTGLEAKLCQVESKYLVLLQEVKSPVCSSTEETHRGDVITREYDIYGFKNVLEEENEEEILEAKKRALDLKSLSLTDQETSVRVKWESYLAITMNREMIRSPELKALVRSGVPHIHRPKVWSWCVSFHVNKIRECQSKDYYLSLLNMANDKPNPACKQIELDLLRTLPNNKHYASPDSDGIQKLRNVLLAFAWRNPDIGYCQGLNRLAAIALLYLDQEDAFWCLVAIVEVLMPHDYYTKTLLGSQVDQRVFKDLMCEKLPKLHVHFEQFKVDFSLITFNWFLVVFVDSVVSEILFKIWDAFLYEGPKIIFRFALALFKYKEEEFLKLQDPMSIFKYLRNFTHSVLDARRLISMAFVDMNPFPLRQIQNRRMFHLEKVRLELTELEMIRQTFLRERISAQEGNSLISDEDEN
ncbi:hypothetical protein DNTS_012929 [Danionella cerebrum]|uniref:Rab-GAP TBC domain-containing protein n=1 Tax=Danionella cerebrum TaxID=2873325 RepID=A0A553NWL9_9TELE|nr:hypothetical protein DNTS_012929 [Danionella translucida]